MPLYIWNGSQYVRIDDGAGNLNAKNKVYDTNLDGVVDKVTVPAPDKVYWPVLEETIASFTYQEYIYICGPVEGRQWTNLGTVDLSQVQYSNPPTGDNVLIKVRVTTDSNSSATTGSIWYSVGTSTIKKLIMDVPPGGGTYESQHILVPKNATITFYGTIDPSEGDV